ACENGCPSISFPLSAPSAGALVRDGSQTACGFLVEYEMIPPFPPARVTRVQPNSPANENGLQPGDVIIQMNGKEVKNAQDIWLVLNDPTIPRDRKADVTLTIERGQKKERVELPAFRPRTLGLQP